MPNYRFIIYLINGKYKFIHFQCERSFASLLDICLFSTYMSFILLFWVQFSLNVCTITLTIPPKSPSAHTAPLRTLLSTQHGVAMHAYVSHIHNKCNTGVRFTFRSSSRVYMQYECIKNVLSVAAAFIENFVQSVFIYNNKVIYQVDVTTTTAQRNRRQADRVQRNWRTLRIFTLCMKFVVAMVAAALLSGGIPHHSTQRIPIAQHRTIKLTTNKIHWSSHGLNIFYINLQNVQVAHKHRE